jgi:hypothetical protein
MPDTIHATDLETVISSGAEAERVRADYTNDADILDVSGSAALLSIALVNAESSRLPATEKEAVLNRVAGMGADWLTSRSLLIPGTAIQVHLMKEIDLLLVSTAWSVGGRTWWVADDGSLTGTTPSVPDDEAGQH